MRARQPTFPGATTATTRIPATSPGKVTRVDRRPRGGVTAPQGAVAYASSSTGAPLPEGPRDRFETSLGFDLSPVRVHTGEPSATAAAQLGARAFAVGQDIHFGAGEYRPGDAGGLHLLAHEVAHTVQQSDGTPRAKLAVSEAGDSLEIEADRAADAMVVGTAARITHASAPTIARQAADPAAAVANTPVFVEFDRDGNWDGQVVLDRLRSRGPVPPDLEAAILAGPKPTAKYCAALRDRATAAGAGTDVTGALTSRINELVHATSRSPLQYSQLADVARWGHEYAASAGPEPAKPPGAGAGAGAATPAPSADPVEAHARTLAAKPNARIDDPQTEEIRAVGGHDAPNEETSGDAAGLPGYTFVRDPFDNTVIAIRDEDQTGTQYTYRVERAETGLQATLVRTDRLEPSRVATLRRMLKAGLTEAQESETARQARLRKDRESGKKTTACNLWPNEIDEDTTGRTGLKKEVFPFTPPTKYRSWRTLADNPAGPAPGDIYWTWDTDKNRAAHVGMVKSRQPIGEDREMWVVSDGGQGGYESIQQVHERERGPFHTKTGMFSSGLADSGQDAGNRKLSGWVDIAAHRTEYPVDGPTAFQTHYAK
jgi:hypothetical protein